MLLERQPKAVAQVVLLPIERIKPNPYQPRTSFDPDELTLLAASIEENGLLQPITVTVGQNGWQLVAGHRRLLACQQLGWQHVPAIVKELPPQSPAVLALVENIHRSGLNCFEEALAIAAMLQTHGLTQQQVAKLLGYSQPSIANKLRLLRLQPSVRQALLEAHLTERHARALLRLEDEALCLKAIRAIVTGHLSVAQTEQYIERLLRPKVQRHGPAMVIRDVRLLFNSINKAVETVRQGGLNIQSTRSEDENYIYYTVSVPKAEAHGERQAAQQNG